MIQAQLDYFKEISARIFIQYTNGRVDSMLRGTRNVHDIFNHCLRLHYLYAIMENARLSGTDVYIGDTLLAGTAIEDVYHKIWHYNGIFEAVDLSDFNAITPDDGDGNAVDDGNDGGNGGDGGDGSANDHYRAGTVSSAQGTNTVTFSTPLPSSDYRIVVRNTGTSGYEQRNLVISTKTANGFVVVDVLEAGTITYFAVIDL